MGQFCDNLPALKHIFLREETSMAVDTEKLNAFMGKAVGDIGATLHAGLVVIGEKLGLY